MRSCAVIEDCEAFQTYKCCYVVGSMLRCLTVILGGPAAYGELGTCQNMRRPSSTKRSRLLNTRSIARMLPLLLKTRRFLDGQVIEGEEGV